MPRRNWSDGQELVYADLNAASSAIERDVYDRLIYQMLQRKYDAFFGDSFKVEYNSATSVTVAAGVGIQADTDQESPEPEKRILYNAAIATKSLTTPNGVNNRIDIVSVKATRVTELTADRKFKDASDDSISTQSLAVQTDWEADIVVTAGTPAGSPAVPSTPAGYIKIAELLVTAGTGMSGSGAVTDRRTLMPVGDEVLHDTLGFVRLTAASEKSTGDLLAEIDNFLKYGRPNYLDFDIIAAASEPAAPLAARSRIFRLDDGVFYYKDNGGTKTPIGTGGGGGSLLWHPVGGLAPVESEENSQQVYLFESGLSQKLACFIKVPQTYVAGRQIKMYIGQYSPSTSNTMLLQATCKLIRKNLDPVSSPGDTRASTNTAITNAVANRFREVELDIVSTLGKVGSLDVSAGDLLIVELSRGTDTDTADIRFIPNATEVKFV